MKITRNQIITQYNRAKKLGWVPHFLAAEQQHTKSYFDAADLMGIGSRETNLDPKWLKQAGDGGHGYGLMQADDRSFPGWIATGEWHKAESGIHKGAEILMMKWRDMEQLAGKRISVKGKTFTGPKLSGFKAQQAVISSYNCGRWALYAAANGKDVDAYSTGKDYSSDVIDRAKIFRELLHKDSAANPALATTERETNTDTSSTNPQDNSQPSVTNAPDPSTEQNVAVVKEEKLGFWQTLKVKITAAFTGIGGATGLTSYAQQAQTFGLSSLFWERIFFIIIIGLVGWILIETVRWFFTVWQKRKRTNTLVAANATPNNSVTVIRPEEIDKYQSDGWIVVHRN